MQLTSLCTSSPDPLATSCSADCRSVSGEYCPDQVQMQRGREYEAWEVRRSLHDQHKSLLGCGTPAPSMPVSQLQYDGENWIEDCDPR